MENKELYDLVVKLIFAIISVVITGYLLPWIKTYMGAEKMDALMVFIEKCVEAAEKLFLPEEKSTKKEYVRQLAIQRLNELGISMSEEALDALIEGFVKSVKG